MNAREFIEMTSFAGRRVVVTGGSGGIGRAIVETFQAAGAEVTSIDRPGLDAPPGAMGLSCDLSRADAIAALDQLLPGKIHSFIHAAGITRDDVHWKMKDEDWRAVMSVNLDSAFHLMKLIVPRLRGAGGGSVVFIASINGQRGKFGQGNYAASKAGLIAFGKTAAHELGRFGIRVNSIAPGWIETQMTAKLPAEFKARAEAESALGRVGKPEHVAGAAIFLASELAAHVTGQVLRVDGGQVTA